MAIGDGILPRTIRSVFVIASHQNMPRTLFLEAIASGAALTPPIFFQQLEHRRKGGRGMQEGVVGFGREGRPAGGGHVQ